MTNTVGWLNPNSARPGCAAPATPRRPRQCAASLVRRRPREWTPARSGRGAPVVQGLVSHDCCYQLVPSRVIAAPRPNRVAELQALARHAELWLPIGQVERLEAAWIDAIDGIYQGRRVAEVRRLVPLVLRGDRVIDRRLRAPVSQDFLRILEPPALHQGLELLKSLRPSKLVGFPEHLVRSTLALRQLGGRCDPETHRWVVYVEQ